MKKVSRNIFLLVIVCVLFLGLSPRLFFLNEVQETITGEISRSMAGPVTVKKMHWVWLPLPHLTLVNTSIANSRYKLTLPKVKIYPDWRLLLHGIRKPAKIILDKPQLHINKTAFQPGESAEPALPEVTLTIKNGELVVESTEEYRDVFRTQFLKFTAIRGRIKLLPHLAEAELHASAPFSDSISLKGGYDFSAGDYRLSLDCRDLKLHKSVREFFGGSVLPVESTAQLSGTVNGRGLQNIEADLHGTLPCFVIKPVDREILLTCGFADMKFLKSGPHMRLDINDLEVKDPRFNISGYVERKMSSENKNDPTAGTVPIWTLDLTGSDLDLAAIRRKILTLWPENKIVKNVTNTVLGGKALSASYRFSGGTADFRDLHAMTIEADVIDADIHVPEADLNLTGASGPIRIENSILSGSSLSAWFGKSYGHNADLIMGLGPDNHSFNLDIDIDADLAALPPVLARIVRHRGFQRELMKFFEVSGKASGTLHLGDNLYNLNTRIDVDNMQLAARYDPVPETIFIDSGILHLSPGKVSWQKVKGNIGPQKISRVSGDVSWQTGDPLLSINEMQAAVDTGSLHAMLMQTGILPAQINNVLESLTGTVMVSGGTLRGRPLEPQSWQYDLALSTKGLTVHTPLLPEPIGTNKLAAEVTNNKVTITDSAIQFLDQQFGLQAELQHNLLQNWYGMITFNGPLKAKMANWISSKGWFPEKLRPQIPCTMEDMQVKWRGETVAVAGFILQGLAGGRLPMARLDYENSPEHLHINELTFYAPGEEGSLKLDFWRLSPHSLVLSWTGLVNADTIDAIFQHSSFTKGSFSGDFKINYLADQPEATLFEGNLAAENLRLKTGTSDQSITIKSLNLKGVGSQLRIPIMAIELGPENISGAGQLAAEKDGLQLDISIASALLSKTSLAKLAQAVNATQSIFFRTNPDWGGGLQLAEGWDITGRIGFDFDSFILHRKAVTPYNEKQDFTYTFDDVHGEVQLAPDKITRTEIFSSALCGLDFKGVWFSDSALGLKFAISNPPDTTLRLEHVLPCLGVEQDIIEGQFSLQAKLLKESDTWYDGSIYIKSTHGRILRLRTLSRIFKLVNITDLFNEQLEYTDKRGFPYSQLDIDSHIEDNNIIVDRGIIRGSGLNLFTRGKIHMDDYDADLTLLIAPFKTFDTIVSKVPIVGQPLIGETGSMVSIPVAIKGPLADPTITPLHPEALGKTFFNLVKDTFMLPFNILKPLGKTMEKNSNGAAAPR